MFLTFENLLFCEFGINVEPTRKMLLFPLKASFPSIQMKDKLVPILPYFILLEGCQMCYSYTYKWHVSTLILPQLTKIYKSSIDSRFFHILQLPDHSKCTVNYDDSSLNSDFALCTCLKPTHARFITTGFSLWWTHFTEHTGTHTHVSTSWVEQMKMLMFRIANGRLGVSKEALFACIMFQTQAASGNQVGE